MDKKKEILHDYLFYFNPYEKLWFAFKREDMKEFFNDHSSVMTNDKFLKANSIKVLLEFLTKYNN